VILRDTLVKPVLLGLEIGPQAVGRIPFKVGNVKTVFREAVDLDQEFPGVLDSFFLNT
jgi:hypothetical protein